MRPVSTQNRADRRVCTGVHLSHAEAIEPSRRDFLYLGTAPLAAVVANTNTKPQNNQKNQNTTTQTQTTNKVDLSPVQEGQILVVKWRGGPVFIRHRTAKEIKEAVDTPLSELKDPQTDAERVQKPQWLIVSGICTHLGCVPLGHEGQYDGWKCPCHGSIYDTSGRIRQGPAPRNLDVVEYKFLTDTRVKIG